MNDQTNNICRGHSGVMADIEHLQGSDKEQWNSIDGIHKMQNRIFGGIIITLMVVIGNLILQLTG